ncbi:GGDEF domain-containing protein [Fusibacter paucivorans]|uniref:GGDEF domain-containing protein n=1 Tax=Fusibacter paucivorans TaxID=76009 RepID=A0ABS5PR97_9FIRM|nr:GGDEF domain-containing protein [Fusibacter paucivorans]MBS7527683.1 GGDEF domain-containing protein [Fusibacter paucivorans]
MKKWFEDKLKILPLEMKIAVFAGIGGIIFSIFTTIGNILLNLGISMVFITIATGIVGAMVVYFALFKNAYKWPSYLILLTLILIIYPLMWLNNAGSYGNIAFFMIFNAVFCSLLLRHLNYKIILTLQILVFYALLYVEYLYPEMIVPYPNATTRLIDMGFAFTLVFLLTFFLVYKIIHEYHENMVELETVKKELMEMNSKLQVISETDELTGICNRRYVMHRLESVLTSNRTDSIVIIMMDIDHFKSINDTYGHHMGDEVLKRISQEMGKYIQNDDTLGRIGGEEFLIVLNGASLTEGFEIAEAIREAIAHINWAIKEMHVTISGGVYQYKDGESLDRCIDQADKLLYQAKHSGRNKIVK